MTNQELRELFSKIEWLPHHGSFQLSQNKRWARHSDWYFKKDREEICAEVFHHYGLVAIYDIFEDYYCYFTTLEKRNEILNTLKKPEVEINNFCEPLPN